MATSNADLQQLWIQAGGNPASAPMAAAIALAESSGNPNASNQDSNGTVDRGYWQINSVHGSQSTFDPMANARAAVALSNNGQNWGAWSTYKNGAYRQFLGGASPNTGTGTGATQASTSSGGGSWVADLFAPIFGTVGNWLIDAGMIMGGLIVFVWGSAVTIFSSKEGQKLTKDAVGGVLTVATGGSVKAATIGAAAAGHVANKRSRDAEAKAQAAQAEKTTASKVKEAAQSRNRKSSESWTDS